MPSDRLSVVVTRRLPEPVETRMRELFDVDLRDPEQIQEYVTHSWFTYPDESKGLHPWDGITEPNYVLGPNAKGSRTRIEAIDENDQEMGERRLLDDLDWDAPVYSISALTLRLLSISRWLSIYSIFCCLADSSMADPMMVSSPLFW